MPSTDFPLRIAWLVYRGNPHVGGQGVYTRYLARELAELGHRVTVFSGQPYPELDDPSQLIEV
ncbi:MAG: glycosyltransferase, partial [Acidimicrobiia bacterium]